MNLLIINVLNKESYQDCHIKNSISVPLEQLESYAQKLDKNQEIILYCARYECPLSRKAWHVLNKLGFKNIRAFEGGMAEWKAKGYPAEGACKADYLKEPNKPQDFDPSVKKISAQELLAKIK